MSLLFLSVPRLWVACLNVSCLYPNSTTNHLERLDPALTRPGRMDVWVEFKNASRWQAELLFTNFFSEADESASPYTPTPAPTAEEVAAMEKEFAFLEEQQKLEKGATTAVESEIKVNRPVSSARSPEKESLVPRDGTIPHSTAGAEAMAAAVEEEVEVKATQLGLPPPVLERPTKVLNPARLALLARQFSEAIPDGEHSVASLQGYLLRNKSRPEAAVAEASNWVLAERDLRSRMKREREERDAKSSIDREKRKKEREEAKRRADREEMRREREEQARIRKEDEEFAAEERKAAQEERERKEKEKAEAAGVTTTTTPTAEATPAATAVVDGTPATPATPAVPAVVEATPAVAAAAPAPAVVEATSTPAVAAVAASAPIAPVDEAKPATPVTEALPSPPASGTSTPAESSTEVDGQTPGAASIVLVRPEAEADPAVATATVSA